MEMYAECNTELNIETINYWHLFEFQKMSQTKNLPIYCKWVKYV